MCFINFLHVLQGGEVVNTNKVILKPLFQKKADPLTILLKDIFKDNRNAMSYLGALSIGLGFSQTDSAFAEEDVEEVVVTASKREANLQDLPMAVQAITSEELEAKNISDFNCCNVAKQGLSVGKIPAPSSSPTGLPK